MKFISLFSGAGGLDLGLELAGWQCAYASDADREAVETLRQNQGKPLTQKVRAFQHTIIEQQDVKDLSGYALLERLRAERGCISLLAGGPPCQSWSSAGHQLGLRDPRGELFKDFVKIAAELDVKLVLFENVRGLVTARGPDGRPGSALDHIRKTLLANGFQSVVQLLNAADYGVPQRRVRLFIIGFQGDQVPSFPAPSHFRSGANSLGLQPEWISLRQALVERVPDPSEEVVRPSPELARQLETIQPGKGLKSPGKAETTRPGGHWGYKQGTFIADLDLPARTVTASAQQDWIRDPDLGLRRLSPMDCAAIQTFPCGWEFKGNRLSKYRLIGNAVPPLLAQHIGRELLLHANNLLGKNISKATDNDLMPLPVSLRDAIAYTAKEEVRNGASRRQAPMKRKTRLALLG